MLMYWFQVLILNHLVVEDLEGETRVEDVTNVEKMVTWLVNAQVGVGVAEEVVS